MAILISVFSLGYHGKTIDFEKHSLCHRTTATHFLNKGKWDDSKKTKPSSQALHPIEDAYFHQSHLKGKQDYGHQTVAVILSCNGIVLNYAIVMYDKSKSKVKIVQEIASGLLFPLRQLVYMRRHHMNTSSASAEKTIRNRFFAVGFVAFVKY